MKLKEIMIILGQIQQVTPQVMKDKQTGKESKLFLCVIADKTKPYEFRTSTPFCMFLTEEKYHTQFGPEDQSAVDENVTLAVHEIAAYNAFMKVKGQMVKGHNTGEALLRQNQAAPGALPQKPVPPTAK